MLQVVSAGLMTLDAAGDFRPQDALTREEAAVALVGLAKLFALKPPRGPAIAIKDEADIAAADREAVYAAMSAGLVRPDADRFRPAAKFTRQEAAVAICRLIDFDWHRNSIANADQ